MDSVEITMHFKPLYGVVKNVFQQVSTFGPSLTRSAYQVISHWALSITLGDTDPIKNTIILTHRHWPVW